MWRSRNETWQNHIKDINDVQAIQSRSFNHWCVAGNTHLMCSMDRKLDQKGPRSQQYHPVPQEQSFSINYRLTTGSPQKKKTHSYCNTKTLILPSQNFSDDHPHDGSPHCLHGWSSTTSSQISILCTIIALPLAQPSTQSHRCILPR